VAAHGRQRLAGARRISCYGAPISAQFGPMGSSERGESVWLTLRKRRSVVTAGHGGVARSNLDVSESGLWFSSGSSVPSYDGGAARKSFSSGRFGVGSFEVTWR
jgi:hypothetical protein